MTLAARLATMLSFVAVGVTITKAQSLITTPETYGRRNTVTVLAEYSNDSSHIILGASPNRKFSALGLQYEHRLTNRHNIAWSYAAEFRPFIFESDPIRLGYDVVTGSNGMGVQDGTYNVGPDVVLRCTPGTSVYTAPAPASFTSTAHISCSRQWSYAQGLSPIGTRVNFRTQHRFQPTISGFGGYMFSTHPIPVPQSGSFNFAFEFGAGLEFYRSSHRSARVEYQVHHFSNHYTAHYNPGVDNGLFKLTYAFGR